MKNKIILSILLISVNLTKASETKSESQSFALENAIEQLDVNTVKSILAQQTLTPERKAVLAQYCQDITKIYRKRTLSIFNSSADRLSILSGFMAAIFGIVAFAIPLKTERDLREEKENDLLNSGEKKSILNFTNTKEKILFISAIALVGPLSYFSVVQLRKGFNLTNAYSNFRKAREIEYLINGINL